MSNMRMKHKLIMSMMAGAIMIPGSVVRTQAAESGDSEKRLVPVTGIENILEASYQTEIKNNINLYLVPTEEGEYLNIAFSNTGDYTYIRSEADENSEWVGKLYSDSAAVVLEYLDGWTKIRSGNAEGYVPTETLFTGEEARSRSDFQSSTFSVSTSLIAWRNMGLIRRVPEMGMMISTTSGPAVSSFKWLITISGR